ncbi:MAG: sialate O-acetylesterase [Phormidesmis sp.]
MVMISATPWKKALPIFWLTLMALSSQQLTGSGAARVVPPRPISYVIAPQKPAGIKHHPIPLASRPSFRTALGTPDDPVSVYLMAGQSNMMGAALQENMDPQYTVPFPAAKIWGNRAEFVPLAPGFDGQYVDFGPELSFGRRIVEHSRETVYLVKSGLGATTLADDWAPERINNSYDRFTQTVDAALAELTEQGVAYEIKGLVWMQGESDVWKHDFSTTYEQNLTQLIASVRARYGTDLAIAIGLIRGDLPTDDRVAQREQVRMAQRIIAASDARVFLVDTDTFGQGETVLQPDAVHYNATGQILLGTAFADALGNAELTSH